LLAKKKKITGLWQRSALYSKQACTLGVCKSLKLNQSLFQLKMQNEFNKLCSFANLSGFVAILLLMLFSFNIV